MESTADDSELPPAYTTNTTTTTTNNNNNNNNNDLTNVNKKGGKRKTVGRRILKLVKSLAGLAALLLAYTFLGAWLMMAIEGPREDSQRQQLSTARERTAAELKNHTQDFQAGLINMTQWDHLAQATLLEFESQVHLSGVSSSSKKKWTFFGSVLFCFTTYTTIGYGNIAPATKAGRVATMLYATLGIPLALIVLADLGRRFATAFKYVWGVVRRHQRAACCFKMRDKVHHVSYNMKEPGDQHCDRHADPERQGSYKKVQRNLNGPHIVYREEREEGRGGGGDGGGGEDDGSIGNKQAKKTNRQSEAQALEGSSRSDAGPFPLLELSSSTAESKAAQSADKLESKASQRNRKLESKASKKLDIRPMPSKDIESTSWRGQDPAGHQTRMTQPDKTEQVDVKEEFKLPVPVAIAFIFAYMFLGAGMYTLWEDWTYLESFYFVFITTSTIGFGDVLPEHPNFFLLSCVYTFLGLALVSMTVNVIMEFMTKTLDRAKHSVDYATEKAVAKARAARGVLSQVGSRAKRKVRKTISSHKRRSRRSRRSRDSEDSSDQSDSQSDDSPDLPNIQVGDRVITAHHVSLSDNAAVSNPPSQPSPPLQSPTSYDDTLPASVEAKDTIIHQHKL